VDDRRIDGPVALENGAKIRLGDTVLEVSIEPVAEETKLAGRPADLTRPAAAGEAPTEAATPAAPEPAAPPPPEPPPPQRPPPPAAPAPAAPPPPAPAAPAPAAAPAAAPFTPARPRRQRGVATRLRLGAFLTVLIVVADAAALVVYFAMR
jgi:pyruvate dehydrogenase E2 component (dihydrolipoyllysine-residue acetyltransferase)